MRIRIQQLFLNADLDPDLAAFLMRIRIQLEQICKKLLYEEFSAVEKNKKIVQKKKPRSWSKFTLTILVKHQLLPVSISLHFSVVSFNCMRIRIHSRGYNKRVRFSLINGHWFNEHFSNPSSKSFLLSSFLPHQCS